MGFGNVTVLVQPKRGCYGAKCTGEVCKILQDPNCPPPHHYLATYRFVEDIFQAHAVLHVGTHGSLEFLPGKANALSKSCYPDLVLGCLPNLYIYNAGVGTEGILAKRRTNAVILDHLPGIYEVFNNAVRQLVIIIDNYFEAANIGSGQVQALKTILREQIAQIPGAGTIIERAGTFSGGLSKLKNTLVQSICYPRSEKLHIYGSEKTMEDILWYIKEVLQSDVKLIARLKNRWREEYDLHNLLIDFIMQVITRTEQSGSIIIREICQDSLDDDLLGIFDSLALEIWEISAKLSLIPLEMTNLLHALNGGYIPPGPSGMPDDNGKNIIPTGRNFYLMDIEKIPTRAAWEVGCRLADQLIDLFRAEEGHYPEKIALNMISLDISRTKGEQLSQILYLMGIRPVWDGKGKVIDLEVIPLEQLQRPRIDVIVRITGVLRDSYPRAVELLDRAVSMAAGLPETEDLNLIKKHTSQLVKLLKNAGEESELQRRSTIRIFGDRPGTYGAGVDLALKASAWKDEQDLAKTFVYFSSYAYGKSLNGLPARQEFIENVKKAQISYDTSNSKRCDILASCFGASVQGGFGLITKVIQGQEIKQYYGSRENPEEVKISRLAEKLQETLEEKLFNPLWKENMQQKGYRGAAELMERLQNVFAWQCLTENIAHTALDRLAEEYINDSAMRKWFMDNNLFAIEEIARRFLELQQREKWQADPEIFEELKNNYLELEGDLEERIGEVKGEIQAGSIEVLNDTDVKEWQANLKEVNDLFNKA
ncbi:MAG: cobaltochelatase subunit CobN [Desulfitobacteriaceae bacterium]|nr:cobaltochelatase subunit CobN [Desulfitobacteriaceae bacterium]